MEKQIYSKAKSLKVVPIGNSKGIRLPKAILQKYGFSQEIIIEEKLEGLLLRKSNDNKLSWEDGFKEMAKEKENWSDFDVALMDGLEDEDF
jgi:antitoxin MazE